MMLTRRKVVVVAFIALSVGIVALVGAAPKLRPKPATAAALDRAETVRFAIYDAGIYPSEARVAAGKVTLRISDYTHGPGLIVKRTLANGVPVQIGKVLRSGAGWRGHVELILPPGTYRVCDAMRPTNEATLIVE